MSDLVTHYAAMGRYNRWMNERLFALAAELPEEARTRDVGTFFGSLQATLGHILLTDRVWLARLGAGEAPPFRSLADQLYPAFDDLRRERALTDDVIDAVVTRLSSESLAADITYRSSRGENTHPTWFALSQLFNHQTHHRGQATTVLAQLGKDPGVTDLIAFLRGDVR